MLYFSLHLLAVKAEIRRKGYFERERWNEMKGGYFPFLYFSHHRTLWNVKIDIFEIHTENRCIYIGWCWSRWKDDEQVHKNKGSQQRQTRSLFEKRLPSKFHNMFVVCWLEFFSVYTCVKVLALVYKGVLVKKSKRLMLYNWWFILVDVVYMCVY